MHKVVVPSEVCELPLQPYEFDDAVAHFWYNPEKIGQTFQEEFEAVPYDERLGLITVEELQGDKHLAEINESELGGRLTERWGGYLSGGFSVLSVFRV